MTHIKQVFKDAKGWRFCNPYGKECPPDNWTRGDAAVMAGAEEQREIMTMQQNYWGWKKFEQSITYYPFPDAPDVKPGEVVDAYLQWQWLMPCTKQDWRNCEIDINSGRYKGMETRQIFVLAGKEPEPNLSEIADKLKDRELFPESNKAAKEFLENVKHNTMESHPQEPTVQQQGEGETVEQAAREYLRTANYWSTTGENVFIAGANWQKHQSIQQQSGEVSAEEAKAYLKSKGLKNPPLDSGISGGGDAPRTYASNAMHEYATLKNSELQKEVERLKVALYEIANHNRSGQKVKG